MNNITTKDFSSDELTSFIIEYIQERDIDIDVPQSDSSCVMNEYMFKTLCREMDKRIIKMTKGVRMSVQQSGRSKVRPMLADLIPIIPRIDERVVLAGAYQNVFGGVK